MVILLRVIWTMQIAQSFAKKRLFFIKVKRIFQLRCSQFDTSWSVTEDFTPEVVVTCSRFPPLVVKKLPRWLPGNDVTVNIGILQISVVTLVTFFHVGRTEANDNFLSHSHFRLVWKLIRNTGQDKSSMSLSSSANLFARSASNSQFPGKPVKNTSQVKCSKDPSSAAI